MLARSLNDWLVLIEATHNTHVDLSLVRMQKAVTALDLHSLGAPVITVAGTNGKGSVVCALETIYHTAGYRTASYGSPHLFKFNERIKMNTQVLHDEGWCTAFNAVYATAQMFQLTYFEVITLAALWFFKHAPLDVIILEVGLGGRLDAVNVIDPVLSIITSIDLDHTERLGATRELIAKEKAGIFRKNTPVICGDLNPPSVLKEIADHLNAPFYSAKNFVSQQVFHYCFLPENINTATSTIAQMQALLPVSQDTIELGLKKCHLPGRQQIIHHHCKHLIDVAHNPAGFKKLAQRIEQEKTGVVRMVFSMLGDKDIKDSISQLTAHIDAWYIAPLKNERAASVEQLKSAIGRYLHAFDTIEQAYQAALAEAFEGDLIVIAGSFHTVAEASLGSLMVKQAPPKGELLADSVPR